MDNNLIVPMGRIIGAFGILGWVKIKTDTQDYDSLSRYKHLLLYINNNWVNYKVENFFVKENFFHVKLSTVNNRDEAFNLKGVIVGIARKEFPPLAADEFYQTDLLNFTVVNTKNEYLGQVTNFMDNGAGTILVIQDETKERLIPFVQQFIIDVSLPAKQITVDWELNY
ncbi:MAG: ribosome maturation factor RimM [Burkholderiales bacterium]|jgi:16S rRNA processing protein RimM|nr:ribosome maturation factor RimM [Burkholderiales bacterium]